MRVEFVRVVVEGIRRGVPRLEKDVTVISGKTVEVVFRLD